MRKLPVHLNIECFADFWWQSSCRFLVFCSTDGTNAGQITDSTRLICSLRCHQLTRVDLNEDILQTNAQNRDEQQQTTTSDRYTMSKRVKSFSLTCSGLPVNWDTMAESLVAKSAGTDAVGTLVFRVNNGILTCSQLSGSSLAVLQTDYCVL